MESVQSFLATVENVYTTLPDDRIIDTNSNLLPFYNNNKNYVSSLQNVEFLGALKFRAEAKIIGDNVAYPFDKNNITFPINGETVIILQLNNVYYWLPYSVTLYPNFRENKRISVLTKDREIDKLDTSNKNKNYADVKDGSINTKPKKSISDSSNYNKNETIKFLLPREGDTIISGRAGNTIRFSEFFLTEDETIDVNGNPKGGTSSPSIFIRNKQNPAVDIEPIGTLVDENIDRDGSSVYITSGKVKVPFRETIKKQKIAFAKYPNSKDFTGDQIFVNSDRILLSAKAKEFIIFGKSNTGIITDGKFSVDSIGDSHIHSDNNIILQTKRNVVISTDGVGNIWLGEVKKTSGKAGESVQRAVLAGELIELMEEMLDAINKMVFATGVGPTGAGPHNAAIFTSIKKRLGKIQSSRTFLSK
jgi:hypothetical protein